MDSTEEDSDRKILQTIKEKSDDDFEKSIKYLSAGALGLSLIFIEKIVNTKDAIQLWLIVTAWILLILTLLINLVSHFLSSYFHELTTLEFDSSDKEIDSKIEKRNKCLRALNIFVIITLVIGVIFLFAFASCNLYHENGKVNSNEVKCCKCIKERIQ